jgi:hypothetical protein
MLGPAVFAPLFAAAVARRPLFDMQPPPPPADVVRAPPPPLPESRLPAGPTPLAPSAPPRHELFALRLASDGATLCFALVALLLFALGMLMLFTPWQSVEPPPGKEARGGAAAGDAPKGGARRRGQSGKAATPTRLSLAAPSRWGSRGERRSRATQPSPIQDGSRVRPLRGFWRGSGGARLLTGSLSSSAELEKACEIAPHGLESGCRSMHTRAVDPDTDLQGIHLAVQ